MPRYGARKEPAQQGRPLRLAPLLDEFVALLEEHEEQMPPAERKAARQIARDLSRRRVVLRDVHGGSRVA